jgi:hypothetical protein
MHLRISSANEKATKLFLVTCCHHSNSARRRKITTTTTNTPKPLKEKTKIKSISRKISKKKINLRKWIVQMEKNMDESRGHNS